MPQQLGDNEISEYGMDQINEQDRDRLIRHVMRTVPEGWERNNALDVMDVMSGGTPKVSVSSYWDGEIPFFTSKDTTDYAYVFRTERALTEEGLKNCNSELYLLWSDETGLPADDYSAAEVATKTDDVFRHVFRVYPTVPSPYCEKAA
jgi:hypothetical protein